MSTPAHDFDAPAAHVAPPLPRRLSEEIEVLLAALSEHPISLREIIGVIEGRAYTLLLILLSLPFCLPLPLPGLSSALGAMIAIIGLRLSLRLEPWLPVRILNAPFSSQMVERILMGSRRVARTLELLLKPRWSFLVDWVLLHHLYGAMICLCGLLLMLPLPIPFSNFIPAVTIILLAAALLERDGVFIIGGIAMFAATLIFFGGLFFGGAAVVDWLHDYFGGVFQADEMLPAGVPLPMLGKCDCRWSVRPRTERPKLRSCTLIEGLGTRIPSLMPLLELDARWRTTSTSITPADCTSPIYQA